MGSAAGECYRYHALHPAWIGGNDRTSHERVGRHGDYRCDGGTRRARASCFGWQLPAIDSRPGASPYLEALVENGFDEIGSADAAKVFSRVFVQDDDAKIAISAGEGHWRYEFLTFPRWPGTQVLDAANVIDEYPRIANARTFAFQEELAMIEAAGLGQGLDAESALILGPDGYLNSERCADEPVRHKMLDAIGDIYLAGIPLRFLNVVAIRTGHAATVKAAGQLRAVAGS